VTAELASGSLGGASPSSTGVEVVLTERSRMAVAVLAIMGLLYAWALFGPRTQPTHPLTDSAEAPQEPQGVEPSGIAAAPAAKARIAGATKRMTPAVAAPARTLPFPVDRSDGTVDWQPERLAKPALNELSGYISELYSRWSSDPEDTSMTEEARSRFEAAYTEVAAQPTAVHLRCGKTVCRARIECDGIDMMERLGAIEPKPEGHIMSTVQLVDGSYAVSIYWPTRERSFYQHSWPADGERAL
jgi:hypothetical protein